MTCRLDLPTRDQVAVASRDRSPYASGGQQRGQYQGGFVAGKRRTTTKDVGLLLQLRDDEQLRLAPEFQRNSVWPRPAKAYLIDSILNDRPIPVLYFQRGINAQSGRPEYTVIDGQQRLRAVFEFLDNKYSLTESAETDSWRGRRWKTLSDEDRAAIQNYDFVVEELSGYRTDDITDMFTRMNRYVVPLNPQERRHALAPGAFKRFVERVGGWQFWAEQKIFSVSGVNRMKADEFAAELTILLLEGPQDKKHTIDLYYKRYENDFDDGPEVTERLEAYLAFVREALPDLPTMQLRRPASFYALIGALDSLTDQGETLQSLNPERVGEALRDLNARVDVDEPDAVAARYLRAASRQTDNLAPREARIAILSDLIASS